MDHAPPDEARLGADRVPWCVVASSCDSSDSSGCAVMLAKEERFFTGPPPRSFWMAWECVLGHFRGGCSYSATGGLVGVDLRTRTGLEVSGCLRQKQEFQKINQRSDFPFQHYQQGVRGSLRSRDFQL